MTDLLLVTDLDHTLVGDPLALGELNVKLKALRHRVSLCYCTGRSLGSARELQREQGLLDPDAWATGVGSSLLWRGEAIPAWDRALRQGWERQRLQRLLSGMNGLRLQDAAEQSPYKLSYELGEMLPPEACAPFVEDVRRRLKEAGLTARVVFSSAVQLDLLPTSAGKGAVAGFLQTMLGLRPDQVLCCGDSGNDSSMLGGPWWGVMVANARPELISWWEQHRPNTLLRATRSYAGAISEALETLPLL